MAKVVAKFYKVSYEQFKKDFFDCFTKNEMITDFGVDLDENGFETEIAKLQNAEKPEDAAIVP